MKETHKHVMESHKFNKEKNFFIAQQDTAIIEDLVKQRKEEMIKANKDGFFPYTPPTHMLRALRASVDLLLAEGLENVFARHYRLAEGVRRKRADASRMGENPQHQEREVDGLESFEPVRLDRPLG